MIDIFFLATSTIAGLLVNYSHQTLKAARSLDSITPPADTISIVIPAYNEEAFIERTLIDLQRQNIILKYPNLFEFIVVDNESTDRTAETASQYARVVTSPRGKLNAMTAGIEASTGNIIVFLDADNSLEPNLLNLLLRHFHELNVVAVSGIMHETADTVFETAFTVQYNSINSFIGFQIVGGCFAIRKDVFYEIGGFNLSIDQFDRAQVFYESEIDFAFRLKKVGRVVIDSEANIWAESRTKYCAEYKNCVDAGPICVYCQEAAAGQRF